ncbi:hypothetical protein FCR2A7T_13520 [Flavobacterium cauense R2A-7]|uniref:Uncharacterized protein n=1 Tax=Flavobacterium cauense R2A-7 TaxID=1341154 RepID=V6S6B7_9FLAO|nr:hypothetical protein [Flavobacterium cauense]ESU19945.1 hypothetical protein FCR2A7T_13520 [Flavobacterium cauense R2A-7]KGO83751.1 hypothetical protein Q762_00440 [Flavobacterium cauense R2A-7]TWI12368.1 hypothetical protein IP98_01580 [Flavobacterium cauense R2A-7]
MKKKLQVLEKFKIGEQYYLNEFNVEWLGEIDCYLGLNFQVYKYLEKDVKVEGIFLFYNCDILSLIITLKSASKDDEIANSEVKKTRRNIFFKCFLYDNMTYTVYSCKKSLVLSGLDLIIGSNIGQTFLI